MTVIAYRDGVLACDSLATDGDLKCDGRAKLVVQARYASAVRGDLWRLQAFLAWQERRGDPPDCPLNPEDDDNTVVVQLDRVNGQLLLWESGWPELIRDPFWAWGTGADYALGAMAMGASAVEAVRIACRFSSTCGGPIQTCELDE